VSSSEPILQVSPYTQIPSRMAYDHEASVCKVSRECRRVIPDPGLPRSIQPVATGHSMEGLGAVALDSTATARAVSG